MSTESDLLAAIIDNPEDDTVRLVYADYIEEQGRGIRAQLIRDQIEFARRWERIVLSVSDAKALVMDHAFADYLSYSPSSLLQAVSSPQTGVYGVPHSIMGIPIYVDQEIETNGLRTMKDISEFHKSDERHQLIRRIDKNISSLFYPHMTLDVGGLFALDGHERDISIPERDLGDFEAVRRLQCKLKVRRGFVQEINPQWSIFSGECRQILWDKKRDEKCPVTCHPIQRVVFDEDVDADMSHTRRETVTNPTVPYDTIRGHANLLGEKFVNQIAISHQALALHGPSSAHTYIQDAIRRMNRSLRRTKLLKLIFPQVEFVNTDGIHRVTVNRPVQVGELITEADIEDAIHIPRPGNNQ